MPNRGKRFIEQLSDSVARERIALCLRELKGIADADWRSWYARSLACGQITSRVMQAVRSIK